MKGTWKQAFITFLSPILFLFCLRWIALEPFVIPSGSMIPTLLEHDHIVVKKYSFGLRFPFTQKWLWMWRTPSRGEVVVFRYPNNPDIFYIKRLIGLPGDNIKIHDGKIEVNGIPWTLQPQVEVEIKNEADNDPSFLYFTESTDQGSPHTVRFLSFLREDSETHTFQVPDKKYFFMGDNRDQSSDSRVWGFVDQDLLIGPAWSIWLSCEKTLISMPFICDPQSIRWNRLFRSVVPGPVS